PKLPEHMQAVDGYLRKSLALLQRRDPKLHDEILRADPGTLQARYAQLDTGTQGEVVEVLGVTLLKQRRANLLESVTSSDFVIRSTKNPAGPRPLVLQNRLNKPFRYVNDLWDNAIQVPYFDPAPLHDRVLPGIKVKYPYLTVS